MGVAPATAAKRAPKKKKGCAFPHSKDILENRKRCGFCESKQLYVFLSCSIPHADDCEVWNVGKAPATIASEMLRPKKTKEDAVDSVISLHLHMLRNEVNVVQAKRFMHGHYRATWI